MSTGPDVLLVNLTLAHFVEILADLHRASGTHEPRFGRPPTVLVVDQRMPSPNQAFNMGQTLRRWTVTAQGAVEVSLVELPLPKRLPGMYYVRLSTTYRSQTSDGPSVDLVEAA